jgi:effector-binding domain-containing protein
MTLHIGPYAGLVAAMDALRDWMKANGREPGGAPWELYVSDPDEVPASELRTEVYFPLK